MKIFTCAFRVLGCKITVRCEDQASFDLLRECYSAFLQEPSSISRAELVCQISLSEGDDGWLLQCEDGRIHCLNTADLLYDFEKTMTLWIQRQRTELFFTHAAALSLDDRCVVISGASGSGKSTLAWSLCHQGFAYLSDELAPIHPTLMHVEPYPHALNLKNEPLAGPSLPRSTIRTNATMHVPAYELHGHSLDQPCRIGAMLFIDSSRNGFSLETRQISSAEAAARLYSNGLNQLANIGDGLPAATRIARSVPSVLVTGGTVEERGSAVQHLF